ncbi:hypothetical protein BJY04DRAFT_186234 [Aspergillus karnatakaensis]|uniref:uncharacterized protein n=1 Tax=Aspergillus karnatakaensis TaxID=1810916 RepID=UPI003CCD1985
MIFQRLPNRYIEKKNLVDLLRRLFAFDYEVEEHPEAYVLIIPRELTEDEIASLADEELESHP